MTFTVDGRDNCAVVRGISYVYATVRGRGFVMRARCPHRGGPLHLATVTPNGMRLVCPWHDRTTSVARLRGEIPAVRSGDRVTAVIPEAAPTAVRSAVFPEAAQLGVGADGPTAPVAVAREYRPLSSDLAYGGRHD